MCKQHTPIYLLLMALLFTLSVQAGEKVFLHFDNTSYYLGDTIWFCAYINDTGTNCPSRLSNILYTEILSPEGDIVETHIYKVVDGKSSGCFALPESYLSGFFEIRAYTRYMLNWGPDNYFTRVFPVFDAVKSGLFSFRYMHQRQRLVDTSEKEDWTRMYGSGMPEHHPRVFKRHVDIQPLIWTADTSSLRPYSKVKLTFHGMPNTQFSLSVTDAANRYHTTYHETVSSMSSTDDSWQDSIDIHSRFFMKPEKSLGIHGRLVKAKTRFLDRDQIEGVQTNHLYYAFDGNGYTTHDSLKTDRYGLFYIPLKDFYGYSFSQIYDCSDSKHAAVTVDKWFSPPARKYRDDEIAVNDQSDADSVYLYPDEHECFHSAQSFFLTDEIEWMVDHYPELKMTKIPPRFYSTSDVVGSFFAHHHLTVSATRLVCYKDSTVNWIYDGMSRPFPKVKYLVLRSDWNTCKSLSYIDLPCENMKRNYVNDGGENIFESYLGASGPCQYPSYILYLVQLTDEDESVFPLLFNTNKKLRYTSLMGFAQDSTFSAPDYAASRSTGEDFRRTLYWNPAVSTDAEGNATVEFYNNASCTHLHVSAEGISADGKVSVCE